MTNLTDAMKAFLKTGIEATTDNMINYLVGKLDIPAVMLRNDPATLRLIANTLAGLRGQPTTNGNGQTTSAPTAAGSGQGTGSAAVEPSKAQKERARIATLEPADSPRYDQNGAPWAGPRLASYMRKDGREGQAQFRNALIKAYGPVCMATGEPTAGVIDAAHIEEYHTNHDHAFDNGILLSANMHRLFDNRLLLIDPDDYTITLHSSIAGRFKHYPKLTPGNGKSLAKLRRDALVDRQTEFYAK